MAQRARRLPRRARLELHADDHITPPRPEVCDGTAEPVSNAAPVQKVDTTVQGMVNVSSLKPCSAARRQTEAADWKRRVQIEARRVQNILAVLLPYHLAVFLRDAHSSASRCIEASRWSIRRRNGRGPRRANA